MNTLKELEEQLIQFLDANRHRADRNSPSVSHCLAMFRCENNFEEDIQLLQSVLDNNPQISPIAPIDIHDFRHPRYREVQVHDHETMLGFARGFINKALMQKASEWHKNNIGEPYEPS